MNDLDSIIVHLGIRNYVANFLTNEKVLEFSWGNSNVVTVKLFKSDQLVSSYQKIGKPSVRSQYCICWETDYKLGIERIQFENELLILANHDSGIRYVNSYRDSLLLDSIFTELKNRGFSILRSFYGKKIISKNIIFNPSKSCYYSNKQKKRNSQEPMIHSGIPISQFNRKKDDIWYVDMVYDFKIEGNRFNVIRLRFDLNGNLINKAINFEGKKINSSRGLGRKKIKKIITPSQAFEIAKKYSSWPIEGGKSIEVKWITSSSVDSLGELVYSINYDFLTRSFDASYAREIIISAVDGSFIEEKEVSYLTFGLGNPINSFRSNGKYGIKRMGQIVIPALYDEKIKYNRSFILAKKNGKYGVIDGVNKVLVAFEFDEIISLEATLKRYDNWYYILRKGKLFGVFSKNAGTIIQLEYESIKMNENEELILISQAGKKFVFDLRKNKLK